MARSEARIRTTIWADQDFTALPIDAQWLYQLLLSQPGVNHAGVLTIPRRAWSNLTGDEDASDRISHAWKVLEDRRYLVSDDETDELLIRSYIRNDVANGPPGPFVAALAAAVSTVSPKLRAALHAELIRLDAQEVREKKPGRGGEVPFVVWERAVQKLAPAAEQAAAGGASAPSGYGMGYGMSEGSGYGMSEPSGYGMTHGMGHGLGEGEGEGEKVPVGISSSSVGAANAAAAAPEEKPQTPLAASDPAPTTAPKKPTKRGTRIPEDFRVSDEMKTWLAAHCPDVDGPRETHVFVDYWRAKTGANATKLDWPATWRVWMSREQAKAAPRRTPRAADPAQTGKRRLG